MDALTRGIRQQPLRRFTLRKPDQDAAQLVQRTDRGGGVIDRG